MNGQAMMAASGLELPGLVVGIHVDLLRLGRQCLTDSDW
jgi:hypothetical protein